MKKYFEREINSKDKNECLLNNYMIPMITTTNKFVGNKQFFSSSRTRDICDEPIFRCLIRFYTKYKIGVHEVISFVFNKKLYLCLVIVRKKGEQIE